MKRSSWECNSEVRGGRRMHGVRSGWQRWREGGKVRGSEGER